MVGRFGLTRSTASVLPPFLSSSSPACHSRACAMLVRRQPCGSRLIMTSSSPPFAHFASLLLLEFAGTGPLPPRPSRAEGRAWCQGDSVGRRGRPYSTDVSLL